MSLEARVRIALSPIVPPWAWLLSETKRAKWKRVKEIPKEFTSEDGSSHELQSHWTLRWTKCYGKTPSLIYSNESVWVGLLVDWEDPFYPSSFDWVDRLTPLHVFVEYSILWVSDKQGRSILVSSCILVANPTNENVNIEGHRFPSSSLPTCVWLPSPF